LKRGLAGFARRGAAIVALAREGKPIADAKISLEICENALAALVEREEAIRGAHRERRAVPYVPLLGRAIGWTPIEPFHQFPKRGTITSQSDHFSIY
jgi:hypothetical protein